MADIVVVDFVLLGRVRQAVWGINFLRGLLHFRRCFKTVNASSPQLLTKTHPACLGNWVLVFTVIPIAPGARAGGDSETSP